MSAVRTALVTSSPSTSTRSPVSSMRSVRAKAARAVGVGQFHISVQSGQHDRAVHGAGVEKPEAQPAGQGPRGALLLPAPAGPSMTTIIMAHQSYHCPSISTHSKAARSTATRSASIANSTSVPPSQFELAGPRAAAGTIADEPDPLGLRFPTAAREIRPTLGCTPTPNAWRLHCGHLNETASSSCSARPPRWPDTTLRGSCNSKAAAAGCCHIDADGQAKRPPAFAPHDQQRIEHPLAVEAMIGEPAGKDRGPRAGFARISKQLRGFDAAAGWWAAQCRPRCAASRPLRRPRQSGRRSTNSKDRHAALRERRARFPAR